MCGKLRLHKVSITTSDSKSMCCWGVIRWLKMQALWQGLEGRFHIIILLYGKISIQWLTPMYFFHLLSLQTFLFPDNSDYSVSHTVIMQVFNMVEQESWFQKHYGAIWLPITHRQMSQFDNTASLNRQVFGNTNLKPFLYFDHILQSLMVGFRTLSEIVFSP